MKKHIIIAAALSVALVGCKKEEAASPQTAKALELETLEQKVSYIIAYDTARRMKAEGFTLDATAVAFAIEHHHSGSDAALTEDEMAAAMTTFQTQIQEKHQQAAEVQAEDNLKRGQEFLATNGKREGVKTTESGLQYEEVQAGTGASPKPEDTVSVNYIGKLINGQVFDSGQGVSFRVDQLIPGWVEALPLMKVGAKWNLFVPAELAYGPGGTHMIAPNSTLVFEMELLSIGEPQE